MTCLLDPEIAGCRSERTATNIIINNNNNDNITIISRGNMVQIATNFEAFSS